MRVNYFKITRLALIITERFSKSQVKNIVKNGLFSKNEVVQKMLTFQAGLLF